jgi:hypothetical protein
VKVLVCGSTSWTGHSRIRLRLAALAVEHRQVTLIHGAAVGADTIAAVIGKQLGFTVIPFPADWRVKPDTPPGRIRRRHGRNYDVAAGMIRNVQMLDEGPDLVIAFQRSRSPGTQHTIDEARRRGIPTEVHEWLEAA